MSELENAMESRDFERFYSLYTAIGSGVQDDELWSEIMEAGGEAFGRFVLEKTKSLVKDLDTWELGVSVFGDLWLFDGFPHIDQDDDDRVSSDELEGIAEMHRRVFADVVEAHPDLPLVAQNGDMSVRVTHGRVSKGTDFWAFNFLCGEYDIPSKFFRDEKLGWIYFGPEYYRFDLSSGSLDRCTRPWDNDWSFFLRHPRCGVVVDLPSS